MRSMFCLLILMCLLLSNTALAAEQYTLPDDIAVVFNDEQWDGYTLVFPIWYTVESGYENGAFYPVIMQKDGVNVLCVLEKQDGAWDIAFTNEHALFSGDIIPENIRYYVEPDAEDHSADYMQRLTISYAYDPPVDNVRELNVLFDFYKGAWNIRLIQIFHPATAGSYVGGMDYRETNIFPSDGTLTYRSILNEKDVQSDHTIAYDGGYTLEDFDINAIPLTY